jgi:hypothetical protein
VDRKGNNYIEKIIFNEERSDLLENPFLEFLIKSKPWNEEQLEQANKISAYYLSINNRYDLDVIKIFFLVFRITYIIRALIFLIG